MLIVEIVLVLMLVGFVSAGYKSGLILTLGRLIAIVIGFWMAKAWSGWLAGLLLIFFPLYPAWAQFAAFAFLLIVIERAIVFLVSLINTVFKVITMLPLISWVSSVLGAVIGLAEGVVFLGSTIYIILLSKPEPHLVAWLTGSTVSRSIQSAFRFVLSLFP